MKNVHLTEEQQKELINGIRGLLPLIDLSYIELISYNPAARLMERDYHHIRYRISHDAKHEYLLMISYYSHGTGYNPETIELYQLGGGDGAQLLHLHLIGYVVDRLRDYGVW